MNHLYCDDNLQVLRQTNPTSAQMMLALRAFLRDNDMMAGRFPKPRRVLKPAGLN